MTQKQYIGFGLNHVDENRYMGWDGKLNAAEFDIKDLSAIAKNLGFETKVFLGKQATVANLRQAFADARNAFGTEGGVLWFNYSGHGGQMLNLETRA